MIIFCSVVNLGSFGPAVALTLRQCVLISVLANYELLNASWIAMDCAIAASMLLDR